MPTSSREDFVNGLLGYGEALQNSTDECGATELVDPTAVQR